MSIPAKPSPSVTQAPHPTASPPVRRRKGPGVWLQRWLEACARAERRITEGFRVPPGGG